MRSAAAATFTAGLSWACAAPRVPEAPSLPEPPAPVVAPAPAPAAERTKRDDVVRTCIDAARATEAHACTPGPAEPFDDVVRAESARFAETTTTKARVATRRDDLAPRPLTAREAAFVERAQRFVCLAPQGPEKNEIRYAVARLYFETRHWEEAADLFHENAEIPDDPTASYAAMLSLECLNAIASRSAKAGCYEVMAQWAAGYHEAFCATSRRPANEDTCARFERILSDIERVTVGHTVGHRDDVALDAAATLRDAEHLRDELRSRAARSTP